MLADLVPHDVAQGWLDYLRRSRPTVPFSTTEVVTSGGADKLVQLLKNYSRSHGMKTALTVGLIGMQACGCHWWCATLTLLCRIPEHG